MFKFLTDTKLADIAFEFANKVIKQLQASLEKHSIDTKVHIFGETKERLANKINEESFDYDFHIEILRPLVVEKTRNSQELKALVRQLLDEILATELPEAKIKTEDVIVGLVAKNLYIQGYESNKFNIDVKIYKFDGKDYFLLKNHKNKNFQVWNRTTSLDDIKDRFDLVGSEPVAWDEFKERYLYWKNKYLELNKKTPLSCSCKIQAVNDIFNKYWQNQ
ncbi:hypothetical protein [Mycoplasma sp. E35C]|uniref:hypothetical protein n=1 Tax=Mycoplasma sp. E35C TaxID=2801918 RepID=UPI001CA44DEF|nr:hypothetical protein [Mycoplasma sp. E35C]QZX49095.1 hypothetical protein JJE79_03510 [Mycoplasma sp. E35C]